MSISTVRWRGRCAEADVSDRRKPSYGPISPLRVDVRFTLRSCGVAAPKDGQGAQNFDRWPCMRWQAACLGDWPKRLSRSSSTGEVGEPLAHCQRLRRLPQRTLITLPADKPAIFQNPCVEEPATRGRFELDWLKCWRNSTHLIATPAPAPRATRSTR